MNNKGKFRRHFSEGGFTLIEILLVIIIAGVLFTLAAPNFSRGYMHLQLNKTAEDLFNLSRWAQAQAIGQGRIHALSFSADQRMYQMVRASQEPGYEEEFEPVAGRLGKEHRIPDGVDMAINDERIDFYPDGNIDPARIQLMSSDKQVILSSAEVRGMMLRLDNEEK